MSSLIVPFRTAGIVACQVAIMVTIGLILLDWPEGSLVGRWASSTSNSGVMKKTVYSYTRGSSSPTNFTIPPAVHDDIWDDNDDEDDVDEFLAENDDFQPFEDGDMSMASTTPSLGVTKTTPPSDVMNYYKDPGAFVEQYAGCMEDDNCHIYFMHVAKTGGTTIEYRMFKVYPEMKKKSCCFGKMIHRFEKSRKKYCNAKFTSYQVMGKGFQKVLEGCREETGKDSRAIALISFREPIQRALSNIHQACNKNFKRRSKEKQIACTRCSYEEDTEYWDRYIAKTNLVYEGIADVTRLQLDNVSVMTIEVQDIDPFFSKLDERLPDVQLHLAKTKNSENTRRCSFGMKSPMFKALRPSEAIYRNLTLGFTRI